MNQIIKKSVINGKIVANPSKSCEQRLIVASLLSRGECVINNSGSSDDILRAREIVKQLGVEINSIESSILIKPASLSQKKEFDCGESAMNVRLFAPVISLFKSKFSIIGHDSLLKRPIAADFYIFKQMGCVLEKESHFLPIAFSQAQIQSGTYNIDGSKSSQLISGLMMSLAVVPGNSELIVHNPVSKTYIELTQQIMDIAGVKCTIKSNEFGNLIINIPGNQTYKTCEYTVEGDWSGAANFLVAAAISGNIEMQGLSIDSKQADKDILKVFDLANVKYQIENEKVSVSKSKISSFKFDATNCPDLIPIAIVLACFADESSTIIGANRLLHKESSRAEVMKHELHKAGIDIEILGDRIIIHPTNNLKSVIFDSHNDHRIAMALSIISIATDGESRINNTECVNKSWPGFYDDLLKLIDVE